MATKRILSLALVAAACTALPVSVAFSQEDYGAVAPDEIDEFIVTARKRNELLQEVPVAVDVISAAELDQLSIDSVENIARYVSGLTYDRGVIPVDTRPVLRGVSALRGRPNVGVLVDFVDVSSEALTVAGGGITTNLRLLDLERVEVVKGPQSALYGRSAFTGAINYITRRPSDEFNAEVRLGYDDYEASDIRLSTGGPLIEDVLNARAIFSKYKSNGYYKNPNTGGELGASDIVGGALGLEWRISDKVSTYFRVEHSNDKHTPRAEVHVSSINPASTPANFLGTGTITDNAIMVPHANFDSAVCNAVDRVQPYYDSFGIPGAQPCRPLIVGELHATEDMIDLSPDPRSGRDFKGTDVDTTRYHLDVNVEFDNANFTYILGYLDNQLQFEEDFDKNNRQIVATFVPVPPPGSTTSQYGLSGVTQQQLDTSQWSHELRLSGENERLNWTLSLLHWEENMNLLYGDEWYLREGGDAGAVLDVLNATVFSYLAQPPSPFLPFANFCEFLYPGVPSCVPAVTSLRDNLGNTPDVPIIRNIRHTSVAGLATIRLTDDVALTLEGRLLDEEIRYRGEATEVSFSSQFGDDPWWGFMFRDGEMTENTVKVDAFVPKVTLDFAARENLLIYGYYSQAFKPGGVSTTDVNGDVRDGVYKDEKLDVYEIGFKSDFRNGSIRWNNAAFFYDYTDQQVPYQIISPTTGQLKTTIINAGKTEIKGFETDLVWNAAFVDGLSVSFGYTFTDAEFTDFNLAKIQATVGGAPSTFNRARAGNADADFTGNVPPLTPKHAATASVRYDARFDAGMSGFVELFTSYQSERFVGEGNRAWLPEYTLIDLYVGLSGDGWSVTVYVENVADDDEIKSGISNVDFTLLPDGRSLPQAAQLYLPQPRTIGARLQVNFGN